MTIIEQKRALEDSFKVLIERARTFKSSDFLNTYVESENFDAVIASIDKADSIQLEILLEYICDVLIYGLFTDDMTADEISSTVTFIENSIFMPLEQAWSEA